MLVSRPRIMDVAPQNALAQRRRTKSFTLHAMTHTETNNNTTKNSSPKSKTRNPKSEVQNLAGSRGCTARQFSDGASRICPGPPLTASLRLTKPTVSDTVGERKKTGQQKGEKGEQKTHWWATLPPTVTF